jgi:hypothetical protein
VATETLRNRAASHGHDHNDVLDWLAAQDTVFNNCVNGSHLPNELGTERSEWLRKDRDYQIAAALFYSLRLDEARARFAAIAADVNSPWQETADYLVGRTLVRQASLTRDETKKGQLYEESERHVLRLVNGGGKFSTASKRLLGLVKYRLRPEERLRELAHTLTFENSNQNLRQDLIDYVWLFDKFENRVLEEEAARQQEAARQKDENAREITVWDKQITERYEAVRRGDLIAITLYSGGEDHSPGKVIYFKPDVSESQILQVFETDLGRKLKPEETKQILMHRESGLSHRTWLMSPNRQLHVNDYEGQESGSLTRALTPELLIADDLSDWILIIQTEEPESYQHAFKRWRETGSHAWLLASLINAEKDSPGLQRLLRAAQNVDRDSPVFPGSFYHVVRLKSETGKKAEARQLLDDYIKAGIDHLPVSTRNLFAEQRLHLAEDLTVFLRSGLRTPVAFNEDGRLGTLPGLFEMRKSDWDPQFHQLDKDEYEKSVDEEFQRRSLWKDRVFLDPGTTEILNTHFTLPELVQVSRSPILPDYLRQRIALAIWTRAIVLRKHTVAEQIIPDILNLSPELREFFAPYVSAKTAKEKDRAALFMLLRNTHLSPLIAHGLAPTLFESGEDFSYYYQGAWWCPPSLTEYTMQGDEVPRNVTVPPFLNAAQVAEAKKDHEKLIEIGDAKSYLGKRVLEWAKATPDDPFIPEALFIASHANAQYKYGCDSWTHDKETRDEVEKLLLSRYAASVWAEKLRNENR